MTEIQTDDGESDRQNERKTERQKEHNIDRTKYIDKYRQNTTDT